MSSSNLLRFGAFSGIVYVVLELAGLIGAGVASPAPFSIFPSLSQASHIAATTTPQGVWIGLGVSVLSVPFFVLFSARLWIALRSAATDVALIATTALIAAGMTVTLWIGSYAVAAALDAGAGKGLDALGALILSYLQDTMVVMSWPPLALFLVAAGAAAARGRSLPAWTSWTAVLIGAATIAACLVPASDLAQMEGFLPYVWIVAASIVLAVRPGLAPQSSKVMIGA